MGDMANAAGSLLTVFDAILPLHANWSIHDAAAGTNAKVYKCDGDVLFYVWIGDNQTNYSYIRVWAAWDAGTHTGSGSQTSNILLTKSRAAYNIYVNGNRFIYINLSSTFCHGHYCGLIKRIDTSKKLVLVYGAASTSYYQTYNWLAGYTEGTYVKLRLLEDVDGNADANAYPMGAGAGTNEHFFRDLDWNVRIRETAMFHKGGNPRYFIGYLDGIVCLMTTPVALPFGGGDIFTVNGMDWTVYWRSSNYERFLVRLED